MIKTTIIQAYVINLNKMIMTETIKDKINHKLMTNFLHPMLKLSQYHKEPQIFRKRDLLVRINLKLLIYRLIIDHS